MSQISELRKEIDKSLEVKAIEFKAVMGRADGEVKVSQNEVYVTLMNGSVVTVYNDRLPRIAFRKIVIGYDDNDPSLLQVLRFDNVYSTRPTAMITNHKESHAWYSHDPIDVYAQQFLPLLPRAIGGLSVRVYGGEYKIDTQFHVMPTTDYDLSAEAPASGAEWVNVEIDSSGVVTYNHGSNKVSRELLLPEDIPTTVSTKKLLCSVKMYIGQSRFIQTRLDSDIFDPRFTGESSAVWGAITGTLSDQTDLQTALNGKVDENAPITGETKTKITYDTKGLVTSGADATTADIADSTDKRYVTDADLVVIGDTSGTNTGDQTIREILTAARTYYVRTDGNDSNTGLVNNSGGAFLTLQKAINVASGNLDIGIYDVTIQLAAGTYSTSVGNVLKTCVGSGKVIIIGDETTPANVVIHCTSTPALFLYEQAGTTYSLRGLKLTSTGSAAYGMRIRYGAALTFQNLNFGSLAGAQAIRADDNGIIEVTGNYAISGGCGFHILLNAGGRLRCQSKTITITGTPAWSSYFLGASFTATVIANGNTYSGSATGARYLVETNAVVYTAGGATYFPGNAAGSTATGGQYL